MSLDTALKRPALYNPALWSRDEVRTYYVARPKLLARFIDDFRREKPGTRPQHRLILGQRGMGKSTLLRRLAIAVDDDNELAAAWIPLVFPEEQYNVGSLADFWLNCLDALGDYLESHGRTAEMNAIDAEVERLDRKDGEGALQTLLRIVEKLERRLILLVDNIDLILDRLKDKDWALREALQEHSQLMLIGASSRALEASYDYGRAFYDFFRIDELRGLSEDEMRETIVNLARLRGAEELIQRLQADPGRLRVLHTLTGGNPRTAVLLYGVLLKGADGDVRSDLEGLLDEVTPLYKARFDELPQQAQQLLDKVALHWDPMTARQVADALGWEINPVSAQLDRLVQAGVIEKVKSGRGKRMAFQVAERFFNIWYLMRASRRVRRKLMWLVEFLRVSFSSDELQRLARERLEKGQTDTAEAEYMLAIGRAIGPMPISRALETRALDCLIHGGRSCLEEMFDLSGEDSDLAPKADRIKARKEAEKILLALLPGEENLNLRVMILGLPLTARRLRELVGLAQQNGDQGVKSLCGFARDTVREQTAWLGQRAYPVLSGAIASFDMDSHRDIEGGEAAAVRYQAPILAIIPKIYALEEKEGNPEKLEELSRQAIEIDRSGACYWHGLGFALVERGEFHEARSAALTAQELAPDTRDTKELLAWTLVRIPSTKGDAEKIFQQLLNETPDDTNALQGLAICLMSSGKQEDDLKALELIKHLLAIEPNNAHYWSAKASLLFGLSQRTEEQLEAAHQACVLAPEEPRNTWLLANSLLLHDQREGAVIEARKWFDFLGDIEITESHLGNLITLLQGACARGYAKDLLAELDKTEAAERFRPTREALAAAVAGTADVLNDVAPEVREPALEVLAIIAPELVPPEVQTGSL